MKGMFWLALLAAICGGAEARAGRAALPAETPADVVSVTDGDTFRALVFVWPDVMVRVSVRVKGIDTPELRGRCAAEKEAALAARAAALELLDGARVSLSEVAPDKYHGRVVARVALPGGGDLAETLLAAGHGRAYDGGRRESWCD